MRLSTSRRLPPAAAALALALLGAPFAATQAGCDSHRRHRGAPHGPSTGATEWGSEDGGTSLGRDGGHPPPAFTAEPGGIHL